MIGAVDRKNLSLGITLVEVMISSVVACSVLFGASLIAQKSMEVTHTATREQSLESSLAHSYKLIERDVLRINKKLPISYGCGELNTGWDFLSGFAKEWDSNLQFGSAQIPLEKSDVNQFPCDRFGFFLDEGEAGLSHVLYFTAHTLSKDPLNLANQHERDNCPRRLFRLYTPPERLRRRLKLIDHSVPGGGKEMLGVPRFVSKENKFCDESFLPKDPQHSAVLSLVASPIVEFKVSLTGLLSKPEETGKRRLNFSGNINQNKSLKECVIQYSSEGVENYHEFLKAKQERSIINESPKFIPTHLEFEIVMHAKLGSHHLAQEYWSKAREVGYSSFPLSSFEVRRHSWNTEIQ